MLTRAAHIHRFRDLVATSLPGTHKTVYLTPKEARAFASAILKATRSVEREPFSKSEGLTRQIDLPEDCTESGRAYTHQRKGA